MKSFATITAALTATGLSKNESRIYLALVEHGELAVGDIARHSGVNRRNAYDTILRLIEKGLAHEIVAERDKKYSAVDPQKLLELVDEKRTIIELELPKLNGLFRASPAESHVSLYTGIEGVKNYVREILRVGEDVYTIGGKAAWADDRVALFFKHASQDMRRKKMKMHFLFDYGVRGLPFGDTVRAVSSFVEVRYLPKAFSSGISADIFGDHVVLLPNMELGYFDLDATLVHIENKALADGFRTWFQGMWGISKP